jgi:hypothetical protein
VNGGTGVPAAPAAGVPVAAAAGLAAAAVPVAATGDVPAATVPVAEAPGLAAATVPASHRPTSWTWIPWFPGAMPETRTSTRTPLAAWLKLAKPTTLPVTSRSTARPAAPGATCTTPAVGLASDDGAVVAPGAADVASGLLAADVVAADVVAAGLVAAGVVAADVAGTVVAAPPPAHAASSRPDDKASATAGSLWCIEASPTHRLHLASQAMCHASERGG